MARATATARAARAAVPAAVPAAGARPAERLWQWRPAGLPPPGIGFLNLQQSMQSMGICLYLPSTSQPYFHRNQYQIFRNPHKQSI